MAKKSLRAFTLIELLVVIAIVGILSGLIIVTMSGATNSATDAKRKTAISGLAKALMAYQTFNGGAPVNTTLCDLKQDGTGCTGFPAAIVPDYMGSIPADPNGTTYYKYYSDGTTFSVRALLSDGTYYNYSNSSGSFSAGNILTLNQSNGCETGTTTGFLTSSSVISAEPTGTTPSWQGSYSLKVITSNIVAYEGFKTDSITRIKPLSTYAASAYLKGSGTVVFQISEYGTSGWLRDNYTSPITLNSNWTKYSKTAILLSSTTSVKIYVWTNSQQSAIFYVDGLQLEEGSSVSAWIPGN